MQTETEGIILKQTKIARGRRMLVIFTKKFGKISAGTSLNEKGKNKSALALRPFVYGKYDIYKSGQNYHINSGEVLSSHYGLGEDIDKYTSASYVLEFTEKILPEEASALPLFLMLADFLDMMERRTKKYGILVVAYQIKALKYSGCGPELEKCVLCGEKEDISSFSITDGGVICEKCKLVSPSSERLLYDMEFDILNILKYLMENPLTSFERLALNDDILKTLSIILKEYSSYHLDIDGLKSEELMGFH